MNINFKLKNNQFMIVLIVILFLSLLFSCYKPNMLKNIFEPYTPTDDTKNEGNTDDTGYQGYSDDQSGTYDEVDNSTYLTNRINEKGERISKLQGQVDELLSERNTNSTADSTATSNATNTNANTTTITNNNTVASSAAPVVAQPQIVQPVIQPPVQIGGLIPRLQRGADQLFGLGPGRNNPTVQRNIIVNQQQRRPFLPDGNNFIRRSKIVPPVCPACPPVIVDKNVLNRECPPCPPCARCPEPSFDCKKVPNFSMGPQNNFLPRPVLTNFSTFGM